MLWAAKFKKSIKGNAWVITADTSLTGVLINSLETSPALSLDTFIQWVSPLFLPDEDDCEVSAIFSELLKFKLLPQDRFFVLEDFEIFHDMHMTCKNLPAKDVEQCIKYIKTKAPKLNPHDPRDREKLMYEVSKFFASSDRQYKQDILKLEGEKSEIRAYYEKLLGEAAVEFSSRENKLQEQINIKGSEIDHLNQKLKDLETKQEYEDSKRSGQNKLAFSITLLIIIELLMLYITNIYAEGSNLLQKAANFWEYFTAIFIGVSILFRFITNEKERLILVQPLKALFTKQK